MTQTISTIVDCPGGRRWRRVYMTQTISTIVDEDVLAHRPRVYMTQTISTIVDYTNQTINIKLSI